MVSHEHCSGTRRVIKTAVALAIFGLPAVAAENARNFYPDDPLLQEPAPRPVKQLATRHVDDLYHFLYNSFHTPRHEHTVAKHGRHPALDTNTLGDVPDSAWYSRRHYYRRMSLDELKRGPGNDTPPGAKGTWRVISAKSSGMTPGFVIEDETKNRYVLKLDPPAYPELASAADVIGSKAFYALGYNTPENYIVHFRRENLEIPDGVTFQDSYGKRHPLTPQIVDKLLRLQPVRSDGTYRGMASRLIGGELLGPFSYEGTRSDDPNDTIPHDDRRTLRGLAVFAAWLNHHDTKAINTMDALVEENSLRYIKHYLIDFGDLLGSDGVHPKYVWSGHEHTVEIKQSALQMVTFGFMVPRWARADYPHLTGVGLFDAWSFEPAAFKPNYPNPAFLLMDDEDAFWAAKQVASFKDDEIRALVETGQYSDPRAASWISQCLIERRDKIAATYFSRKLPLDKFDVVNGTLAFEDLGKGREYSIRWASQDSAGGLTALPGSGPRVPEFHSKTQYLVAKIQAAGEPQSSGSPVTVYLRRGRTRIEVVGIDR